MSTHPVLEVVAPLSTLTAASATFAGWGLHLSDVAVIISSLAAICGVSLQFLIYREQRITARRLAASNEGTKPDETH